MHRKPTWPYGGKRIIDLGFWVAGLEYCAGRPATVVGKPAEYSYETVLFDAGFPAERAVMVSDEVAPDLEGARRCGIAEVLFDPTGAGASGAPGAGRRVARSYAELAAALERASSLSS